MNKTSILITVIALSILGGGIWYYCISKTKAFDIWEMVPSNAAIVYESTNISDHHLKLSGSKIYKSIGHIPVFMRMASHLEILDSLSGSDLQLSRLMKDRQVLISLHVTKKDDFDYLFLVDMDNVGSQQILLKILQSFKNNDQYSLAERVYKDYIIKEVTEKKSGLVFSYLIQGKIFAASFTPFLIEDVIRTLNGEMVPFAVSNSELENFPKLVNDEGNLYLNSKNLGTLLGTFLNTKSQEVSASFQNFFPAGYLDLNIQDQQVMMSGFTAPAAGKDYYFNYAFQGQHPVSINLFHLVPARTASMTILGLSSPDIWYPRHVEYWLSRDEEFKKVRNSHESTGGLDLDKVKNWLGRELALINVETPDPANPGKVIIMDTKDISEALNQLNAYSEKLAFESDDTLFVEKYGDFELREIKSMGLPMRMFGPWFSGFDETFYTVSGSYLIMGNSIVMLKQLIMDIEAENTWKKSTKINKYLESNLSETNVGLIFNTQRFWLILKEHLGPSWKALMDAHSSHLMAFDMGSVQMTRLDNNFYQQIALNYDGAVAAAGEKSNLKTERKTSFSKPLISRPYLVRNHVNLSFETIIQDSTRAIHLISSKGEQLWKYTCDGPIISDVHQIDFYKNSKLQYLFATKNTVYLVDRLGNDVEGFPLKFNGNEISHVSLIDYDNSKNYRILISDPSGELYMYDKMMNNLDGWRPNGFGGKLATKPFHIRVRGRDYIVGLLEKGTVVVKNRRGETIKGFPLDLGTRLNNAVYVALGPDAAKTILTTISSDGLIIQWNLEGNISNREQLYKPTRETTFRLVNEKQDGSYLIARQDFNRMTLIDQNGKIIFEKDYLGDKEFTVQFYDFGNFGKIFAITDGDQEFTYLYDEKGILINSRPLLSSFPIGLLFFENQTNFNLYTAFENELSVLSF